MTESITLLPGIKVGLSARLTPLAKPVGAPDGNVVEVVVVALKGSVYLSPPAVMV
jgi:hypothetical protein